MCGNVPTTGRFHGLITHRDNRPQFSAAQMQAMAQRHTMEQKSLQETQEAKPAAKHEAPHG